MMRKTLAMIFLVVVASIQSNLIKCSPPVSPLTIKLLRGALFAVSATYACFACVEIKILLSHWRRIQPGSSGRMSVSEYLSTSIPYQSMALGHIAASLNCLAIAACMKQVGAEIAKK